MSAILESEESLGSRVDKHVAQLEDLDKTLASFKQDLPALKRQCERFKSERAALQTEVASLKSERDVLRVEVTHEFDRSAHLKEEYLAAEFDAQGRANRRIWVLEQQNGEMKREMEDQKKRHEEETEKERNVSSGLRDRIGALDEKRKRVQDALDESKKREIRLQSDLDAMRLARQLESRQAGEIPAMGTIVKQVTVPTSDAAADNTLCTTPSKKPAQRDVQSSSRSALQKRSSNMAILPTTPTKTPNVIPQPTSTTKKRSSASTMSPTSLAKRCAMLEERHGLLKAEYDKLRTKYQEDIKHWKEWKAIDAARREEKKKRKEQRSSRSRGPTDASNSNPNQKADATSTPIPAPAIVVDEMTTLVPPSQESTASQNEGPTASQEPSGSQRVTRSQAKKRKAEDGRVSDDPPHHAHTPVHQHLQRREQDDVAPREVVPMPPPSQKRRSTRTAAVGRVNKDETPTPRMARQQTRTTAVPASETRKKVTPAARVTAWLGTDPKPRSTTAVAAVMADVSQDPFDIDINVDQNRTPLKRYPSIPYEGKTPLVRDRGEGPGPGHDQGSSLRRTALHRTFSTVEAAGTMGETPETSRARVSVSPAPDSVKKRRLDMEGLSPAEKARERKRLNKMTPAEKRELYAGYKGKGRYLPPDEVQRGVADEYEIDPKQNEGVAYPYHDVKRGRAERKAMHGGDCECCTGYYEAVGALPRYNAGPAWKDPSQHHEDDRVDFTEAQIREHQNKVSRHRETWVKPPTPPGYWHIGFPNTQDVEEQNKKADAMVAEKEAKIRREVAHRDSKWKKKAP